MTVKELKQDLKVYKDDMPIASILWVPDDVLFYAENDMETKITKEEAEEVIRNIHHHADCEMGISWTTIECGIDDMLYNRKEIELKKE